MTMTSLHVVIIGGGIGGLCLAQGLKKSGISVAVYERDQSADFRGQGYRLNINPDGSHALRECLPENLLDLVVATSGKPAMGRIANFDSQIASTELQAAAACSNRFTFDSEYGGKQAYVP